MKFVRDRSEIGISNTQEMIVIGEEKVGRSAGNKRKRSKVWDEFRKCELGEDGKTWVICSHCDRRFDGSSKKGTTHLSNHLKSCRAKKRKPGEGDESIKTPQIKEKSVIDLIKQSFDAGGFPAQHWNPSVLNSRKVEILQAYQEEKEKLGEGDESIKTRDHAAAPPLVVEIKEKSVIDLIKQSFDAEGFPTKHWNPSVLNSRKVEILQAYQEEKEKLGEFLQKLSCRFTLEIKWINFSEYVLRVHYIDDNWEQQCKHLLDGLTNFLRYYAIDDILRSCLEWKIDRNICAMVDYDLMSRPYYEKCFGTNSWFIERASLPFGGFLLDVGELLRYWVLDFLKTYEIVIDGIRQCVDYVYEMKTYSNKITWQRAIIKAMSKGKKVIFDDEDDTAAPNDDFKTLENAVGLKEAFAELEKMDPDFSSINLTDQKWDEAAATFNHLKVLIEFSDYYRRIEHFTTGIQDFCKISYMSKELVRCNTSENCHVCKDASFQRFVEKHWNIHYLVRVITIILDPRFKLDTVQLCYGDADGYMEKIIKDFRDIYNEYAKDSSKSIYKMVDATGEPCTCTSSKSEIDLYLKDLKVPRVKEFDVLAWWRGNAPFYPTLARMARDYFAIPILGTNASTFKKEINFVGFSGVHQDIIAAVACLKAWL